MSQTTEDDDPMVCAEAEEPEPHVVCPDCGDGVYFVAGVVGKARWRHCRTGDVTCHPLCARCGEAAVAQIGTDDVDGGGALMFRRKEWRCRRCMAGQLFIERT